MDKEYVTEYLKECKEIMSEQKRYLIDLDSVVGDGDLGLTMSDGFAAAYQAVADTEEKDVGKVLYQAGKAMSTAVPSTMGTLMASGLMQAGKTMKGKTQISEADVVQMFQAYADGVEKLGKAKEGEKTFLDGMAPAVRALNDAIRAGKSMKEASQDAADAAEAGFRNTTTMVAVHGRAATRGEASRTLEDPGAATAMLLMKAFRRLNER